MKRSTVAVLASWPASLASDLWNAARGLRRHPILVAATIATLALGIGANVAVFLVAEAALFESSGFHHAERTVALENAEGTYFGSRDSREAPDLGDWQRQSDVFEDVAVYARGYGNLQGADGAERISIAMATPRFLSVLGVIPAAGRDFLPDEELASRANVAMLSDELWRRDFAASREVIGKSLQLSGRTYTIVGVMPRDFRFPGETDLWIPLTVPFDTSQIHLLRMALIQSVVARLQDGVAPRRAQLTVDVASEHLAGRVSPVAAEARVLVTPFLSHLSRGRGAGLALLASMSLLLLFIATANVSNLLLTRASSRLDELRLRIAIGGGSFRIAQQVMMEPLLLSLAGGTAGLALALWSTRAMVAMRVVPDGDFGAILLNARVYGVAFGVSIAAGMFAGLLALATLRKQAHGIPGSSRTGASRVGSVARTTILGVQVTLSFVLLVATGLVIRSLTAVLDQDADLPSGVLTAEIALSPTRYPNQVMRSDFASAFLQRILEVPGVRGAGVVSNLPLSGGAEVTLEVKMSAANDAASPSRAVQVDMEVVSPGYFRTMGLAVLQGRDVAASDGLNAPPVAVISANMANKYWPGSSPVGAYLWMPGDSVPRTIVGVVRTIRSLSLVQSPIPQVYFPYAQMPTSYLGVVVSAGTDASRFASAIRSIAHSMDNTIPVYRVRTFGTVRRDSVAPQRNRALILGAFGALAIALGAIGVYGAAAYMVDQRTPEIGIRRALGAPDAFVFRRVILDTLMPVFAGLVAGGVIAAASSRLITSVLYGVGPDDPATFAAAGAGLLIVALVATALPASKATRIDPLEVMRVR
ncbi:MAG TPA: ABC transporter permease [Gemmatimonadaceae bacterium]|nr:ABC transporter permease [Gemmatimonadaceae bacterium]